MIGALADSNGTHLGERTIGLPIPLRADKTPAIKVLATAPMPGSKNTQFCPWPA